MIIPIDSIFCGYTITTSLIKHLSNLDLCQLPFLSHVINNDIMKKRKDMYATYRKG